MAIRAIRYDSGPISLTRSRRASSSREIVSLLPLFIKASRSAITFVWPEEALQAHSLLNGSSLEFDCKKVIQSPPADKEKDRGAPIVNLRVLAFCRGMIPSIFFLIFFHDIRYKQDLHHRIRVMTRDQNMEEQYRLKTRQWLKDNIDPLGNDNPFRLFIGCPVKKLKRLIITHASNCK